MTVLSDGKSVDARPETTRQYQLQLCKKIVQTVAPQAALKVQQLLAGLP